MNKILLLLFDISECKNINVFYISVEITLAWLLLWIPDWRLQVIFGCAKVERLFVSTLLLRQKPTVRQRSACPSWKTGVGQTEKKARETGSRRRKRRRTTGCVTAANCSSVLEKGEKKRKDICFPFEATGLSDGGRSSHVLGEEEDRRATWFTPLSLLSGGICLPRSAACQRWDYCSAFHRVKVLSSGSRDQFRQDAR